MFDCKCGKRHKKNSDIGRAHYKKYFPTEAAIERDKPDPTVHAEVMEEIMNAKVMYTPAPVEVPQEECTWKPDENQRHLTVYALDRWMLDHHTKRDIMHLVDALVTKNHEELKANWRASSWEDKETHAMIPLTIDEELKYAMLVDARNKKKTGLLRKKRAIKALKEAVKPWDVTTR